jgi:hypothetical protein
MISSSKCANEKKKKTLAILYGMNHRINALNTALSTAATEVVGCIELGVTILTAMRSTFSSYTCSWWYSITRRGQICLINSPVTEFSDGIMMRRGLYSRKEGYSRNCSQCESL